MKNDLKEITNFLAEKGFTPSEFMVAYELSCITGFYELNEADQQALCDKVYLEYLRNDFASLEEAVNENIRTCSHCGRLMIEGYCIEGGQYHYCSDECLHKHFTKEDYEELYDEGNGDSYYTDWR
jgi:hypothetical protein